ncbi:drug/metabolite transporter (DMT)-like permease [Nocardioides thalensis]|uniref:Drug/metabolite transporter (DMT)-like permease n=1 Tax=Nocardioides thalensis TaxID=1914755 RepID=A0A853BZF3_9ACTN|nr:drug/metabolite transporter (DMT)-like permease [Nocardioides thalensis]
MGFALVLLSAACFGAMAVFGKLAYAEGVSPQALVLLRFVAAAMLLAALSGVLAGRRSRPVMAGVAPGNRVRLVVTALALGALGYATQASLYFSALERVDAALVALVLYTYPVLVTLAAAALGRDRLTPARIGALGLATGGTLLVLVGSGPLGFDTVGVALAFGAALTYTVYILVADDTVRHVPPLTLTTLVMIGAACALAVRAGVTGGVELETSLAGWFWIACIAMVSTVVASTAFFAGLHLTGPTSASILSTFEPVATAVLASMVLGEHLTPLQVCGGSFVLASAVLVQVRWRRARRARTHGRERVSPESETRRARNREVPRGDERTQSSQPASRQPRGWSWHVALVLRQEREQLGAHPLPGVGQEDPDGLVHERVGVGMQRGRELETGEDVGIGAMPHEPQRRRHRRTPA